MTPTDIPMFPEGCSFGERCEFDAGGDFAGRRHFNDECRFYKQQP